MTDDELQAVIAERLQLLAALVEYWEASWAIEAGLPSIAQHNAAIGWLDRAQAEVVRLMGRQPVALQDVAQELGGDMAPVTT